jgi:hypothetical protein
MNTYVQQSKATLRARAHSQSFRETDKRLDEFRTQCFWSAMRHRIAFGHRGKTKSRLTKEASIKCMRAASFEANVLQGARNFCQSSIPNSQFASRDLILK